MGLYLGEEKVTTNFSRQGTSGGVKDWNVNDETSPEYIKNRPLYKKYLKELVFGDIGTSDNGSSDWIYYANDTFLIIEIINGRTYRISFHDKRNNYKEVYSYDGVGISNNIEYTDSNNKKYTINNNGIYVPHEVYNSIGDNGNIYIKIAEYIHEGEVIVENDYLNAFQSDWNETDETSPAFIKNKPFQDEISAQNIYHITNGYSAQGFTTPTLESTELNQINELIVGEHYMFIINDTTVFDAVATSKTKLSYNSY